MPTPPATTNAPLEAVVEGVVFVIVKMPVYGLARPPAGPIGP